MLAYRNIFTRLKSPTGDETLEEFYKNAGAIVAFLVLWDRPQLPSDKRNGREKEPIHEEKFQDILARVKEEYNRMIVYQVGNQCILSFKQFLIM